MIMKLEVCVAKNARELDRHPDAKSTGGPADLIFIKDASISSAYARGARTSVRLNWYRHHHEPDQHAATKSSVRAVARTDHRRLAIEPASLGPATRSSSCTANFA
jgi:hypothetical protein